MKELVERVTREARIKMGGQKELLAAISPLVKRTYRTQAVSSWEAGANMPAYVLLAIAKVANISLDELVFGESMLSRQDSLEREVRELRRLIETRPLLAGAEPPQ